MAWSVSIYGHPGYDKEMRVSALPYSPPVEIPKPVQKETMNQLRSSFNLPDTGSTTHTPPTSVPSDENNITSLTAQTTRSVPYYSHSTTAYLAHQPTVGAEGPSNPMSQPFMSTFAQHQMPFATQFSNTNFIQNGAQHFTAEQLAVAFIQQQQAQEQVPLSHSTESTIVSSSNSIAPPPPPVHPWPDENKENGSGDEPVWVLRDSYLKRMQRDEREQVSEWREETTTPTADATLDNDELETDRLLLSSADQSGLIGQSTQNKKKNSKESVYL
uniref:Uncharacterized protein n=1 Tax=Heterorhabditis bacteriophora TaxID=37862 RepID=A0A1I7WZN8_HETBA